LLKNLKWCNNAGHPFKTAFGPVKGDYQHTINWFVSIKRSSVFSVRYELNSVKFQMLSNSANVLKAKFSSDTVIAQVVSAAAHSSHFHSSYLIQF
jgi:hypothetical protein